MAAKRYADADDKQSEGIGLLRSHISDGRDAHTLALALQVHATLAELAGDRAAQRSRLQEALAVADAAGDAGWVAAAKARIQTKLADAENAWHGTASASATYRTYQRLPLRHRAQQGRKQWLGLE